MGDSKFFLIVMALIATILLSFQGCSGDSFRTFGNGDPHEGLDGDRIVVIDDTPIPGTSPDISSPPANAPPNGGSNQEIETYYLCNIQTSNDIDYLAFATEDDSDIVTIRATGYEAISLYWDFSKVVQTYAEAISNHILLKKILFDASTKKAEVHYRIENVDMVHRMTCIKKQVAN